MVSIGDVMADAITAEIFRLRAPGDKYLSDRDKCAALVGFESYVTGGGNLPERYVRIGETPP